MAFPIPVESVFTYVVPESLLGKVALGSHVLAFLGRRKLSGFVVGAEPREGLKNVKALEALIRAEPVFAAPMLALARRVAEHYLSPLGEILAAAYPGHADKRPRARRAGEPAGKEAGAEPGAAGDGEPSTGGATPGRTASPVERGGAVSRGPAEAGSGRGTEADAQAGARKQSDPSSLLRPPEPGASRVFVFNTPGAAREGLYPRLAGEVVAAGGSVLFLVPEVSTASTLVALLKARFGPGMALFHSMLRISERRRIWEDCRTGRLRVVVGTRSAVFLPLQGLRAIIVEDEHAQPYKQEETPRYNGRDVALMRAELEGVPVVLASATPSVETYLALKRGEYRLFEPESMLESERLKEGERFKEGEPERPEEETPGVEAPGTGTAGSAECAVPGAQGSPEQTRPGARAAAGSPEPERPAGQGSFEFMRPVAEEPLEAVRPSVTVVDMRNWDNVVSWAGEFSPALASAVGRCLEEKRRALIFLNRRGFSSYVQCQDCGAVETCPSCGLPLVLHSGDGALVCHHCGHKTPAPSSCRKCKGVKFRFGGAGIEKVEAQLKKIAPSARVGRIDLDSVETRDRALSAAGRFASGELDVLVGTLMVMKGFDLGEIALVGVLHAETQLNIPDFRSGERAFQLLSEVVALAGGRVAAGNRGVEGGTGDATARAEWSGPAASGVAAGGPGAGDRPVPVEQAGIVTGARPACPGEVIIQTLNPDHHSVTAIAAGDAGFFYEQELKQREELGYPPFSTLVAVHISGPKEPQVLRVVKLAGSAAASIASSLDRQGLPVRVLGPSPGYPARSRGQFRWRMSIRAEKREAAVKAAREILAQLGGKHEVGGVTVSFDVDPVGA